MFWFGKRTKKEQEIVEKKDNRITIFVDYEYWNSNMRGEPQVEEWIRQVIGQEELKKAYFYGNFFQEEDKKSFMSQISSSLQRQIEMVSPEMSERMTQKGKASMSMLGGIYEVLLSNEMSDKIILFTGDGNFRQVAATLRKKGKKVILYHMKGICADILPLGMDEVYVFSDKKEKTQKKVEKKAKKSFEQMILSSLQFLEQSGKKATYGKTIANVAKHNHVPNKKVHATLDQLIANGYVDCDEIEFEGKKIPILTAKWDKINADQLFEKAF